MKTAAAPEVPPNHKEGEGVGEVKPGEPVGQEGPSSEDSIAFVPEPGPKTPEEMAQDPKDAVDDKIVDEMSAKSDDGTDGTQKIVAEVGAERYKSRKFQDVSGDIKKAGSEEMKPE